MFRKYKINLIAALVGFALIGCSPDKGPVTVRIVATSDIHGRIFDKDCLSGEEREGSMAKFSSFLRRQRKEYSNVIYLDAGDMLQGSVDVYQDFTAQFDRTSLPAEAFNLLGCFATVMGNHDFAIGAAGYDRYFRSLKCPVLGANVFFEKWGDYLSPYRIREIQGVRIAVIGMTTPLVNYQMPADRRELELTEIVEAARHWMPILKEKEEADIVIGLFHSGFDGGRTDDGQNENIVRRIINEVPGFDIIFFGHDHRARSLKMADCNGDSVLLLDPGPFMTKAAVATLTVSADNHNNIVVSTSGELVDVTIEKPDRRFMRKLSGWYDDVDRYANSVVGKVSAPIEADGILWRRSSLMDMIHSVQMGFGGAEVSLATPVFTKSYFPSGEIQMKDLFGVYEYDNTMVSVMMKGSEIKSVLENSASQFYNTVTDAGGQLLKLRKTADGGSMPRRSVSGLVTAAGIDYEVDVTKPEGSRVQILSMSNGKPFDADRMYRTTINSNQYSGTSLARVMGITPGEMRKRFNGSSAADIRYFMLTDLSLRQETGQSLTVREMTNWKLVPENIVSGCLASDTVGFNIIQTQTSN